MIDLYKRKKTPSARKIFIFSSVAFFVLLILFLSFFRLNDSSFNERIWRFGLQGQTVLKVFKSYLISKNHLLNENLRLKTELEKANLKLIHESIYEAENQKLKQILGRNVNNKIILAQILSKPNRSPYDIIVIDVGENDGVLVGQRVIANGIVSIGEVAEVSKKDSKVKLYSTPGSKIFAVLEGSQIDVELNGAGSGGFEIIVPKDVSVHVGQAILAKSLNLKTIAIVSGVVSNEYDSFKKVLAKSPINIQQTAWVEVVID